MLKIQGAQDKFVAFLSAAVAWQFKTKKKSQSLYLSTSNNLPI